MSVHLATDADGYVVRVIDLYHRTDVASAAAIVTEGRFVSHCQNRHEAYFCDRADGARAAVYGPVVVHVQVPVAAAVVDERFADGEVFYRVALAELAAARIVGVVEPAGAV